MPRMLRMARTPRMACWLADYPDPICPRLSVLNFVHLSLSSARKKKGPQNYCRILIIDSLLSTPAVKSEKKRYDCYLVPSCEQ